MQIPNLNNEFNQIVKETADLATKLEAADLPANAESMQRVSTMVDAMHHQYHELSEALSLIQRLEIYLHHFETPTVTAKVTPITKLGPK